VHVLHAETGEEHVVNVDWRASHEPKRAGQPALFFEWFETSERPADGWGAGFGEHGM